MFCFAHFMLFVHQILTQRIEKVPGQLGFFPGTSFIGSSRCYAIQSCSIVSRRRFDLTVFPKSVNPLNVNVGPSVTKNVVGAVKKT